MAAAYQTGTATSPTNLLQTLVAWLVAQGWTSNMSQADGTGWRAHLSKGGVYVNFRATPGGETIWAGGQFGTAAQIGIGLYAGTGYSGASAWNTQAGGPIGNGQSYTVGSFMQLPNGSNLPYNFFDDGTDNIIVVVELASSIFTHMGWGPSLVKAGAWIGGAYFFAAMGGYYGGLPTPIAGGPSTTAHCPMAHGGGGTLSDHASFVRADVDSFASKWLGIGATTDTSAQFGYTGKHGASSVFGGAVLPGEIPQYGTSLQSRMVSALNSQANLLPVRIFAARDVTGYSLLGDVPNIFFSSGVGNGYAARSIYPLGPDNYMLFPKFAILKKA